MNTKLSINRKSKRMLANLLSIFAILAIALPVTQVAYAVSSSPFVGHWQATDMDGSDIRLTISGPPSGPLQITWTESYMSFCNREAGIVRGTGQLNKSDPNLLEADLHLECFTTGASLDFHLVWRYHPMTSTLSSRYDNGVVTVWHRPGQPLPPPPVLGLRVNYGHDWVESFYEGGHMAWVTVTESDGVTVKATAELVTEPKDFWGGETGFTTQLENWVPAQPDIQPNDWVFGWVDNGASAQVQIGDISGTLDLANDSITGAIMAPWITDPVQVECLDWGSGREPPFENKDGGSILTNGTDPYSCSWAGEWDIQPGQTVGVGYLGSDGNWVANAFATPNVRLIAFPAVDQVFGYNWPEGSEVYLTINNPPDFTQTAIVGPSSWDPNDILALFDFNGQYDLKPGDLVTLSGSGMDLTYTVLNLSVTNVDVAADTVSGTADPGAALTVVPFEFGNQALQVMADEYGNWLANFAQVGINLVGGMCGRSEMYNLVTDNSTAVDWCTPIPTFVAYVPGSIEGYDWTIGSTVSININDGEYTAQAVSEQRPDFPEGSTRVLFETWRDNFYMKVGDHIVMTDGVATKETSVTNLAVTDINLAAQTVSGTYDPDFDLSVSLSGEAAQSLTTDPTRGTWTATFAELTPGAWGGAVQHDADGDGTSIDFQVPSTLLITSTQDGQANDGICTLREAIIAANTNAPSGDMQGECPAGLDGQADTIVLVAGNTYSLTIDRTDDTPADGDLDIWDNSSPVDLIIMVQGDGKASISQDASQVDDRVLENHGATVQIENLIFTGGGNVGGGGGILNGGTLDLRASEVRGNSVSWDGGGLYNSSAGNMSIDSSTIANNSSSAFAGGIMNKGQLTVNNSVITANTDLYGGGGINNEGMLTVDGSILSANRSGAGGGLYNSGTAAIKNGTVVGGAAAEDANVADGGGLFNTGNLTVEDSTVTGNRAIDYGGGLFNWTGGMLTVSHSTVSNNWANEGGGLHNKENSTTVIQNGSVFSNNYAEWGSGGIDNWGTITITGSVLRENNSAGVGDAIATGGPEGSSASLTSSCIVGNGDIAVFNDHQTRFDATGNWWGDLSGPTHWTNPTGTGDSVSDNIDFSGWLLEPPAICMP
ncbi:MAG TPA: hypothetical protein VK249_30270 [Anaerolineales bacterium]|nr:hypothetical protein [Anaerolineales bacterium]